MIRFGVIGTSWITKAFIHSASQCADFQLAAVYSRTEARAKEFAEPYDNVEIFTDLEQMAARAGLDAVYIASPNSFHARQAILFLEHQKHVLCEKPLASNVQEIATMMAVAERNQVVLMEAMKTTLLPNFQAIRHHLPKIGPIRRFFSNYCQYSSRYDLYKAGKSPNTFEPCFSNGGLMDLGVYCLYPVIALFGAPDQIQANAYRLASGVDGQGGVLLQYPEMDAVVMYSKITQSSLPSEIQGEHGNIIIDKIFDPGKVVIVYRDGVTQDITRPQPQPVMYYEVQEFIDLIKSGRKQSHINSHALSLAVMRVMDNCRRQFGLVFPADRSEAHTCNME